MTDQLDSLIDQMKSSNLEHLTKVISAFSQATQQPEVLIPKIPHVLETVPYCKPESQSLLLLPFIELSTTQPAVFIPHVEQISALLETYIHESAKNVVLTILTNLNMYGQYDISPFISSLFHCLHSGSKDMQSISAGMIYRHLTQQPSAVTMHTKEIVNAYVKGHHIFHTFVMQIIQIDPSLLENHLETFIPLLADQNMQSIALSLYLQMATKKPETIIKLLPSLAPYIGNPFAGAQVIAIYIEIAKKDSSILQPYFEEIMSLLFTGTTVRYEIPTLLAIIGTNEAEKAPVIIKDLVKIAEEEDDTMKTHALTALNTLLVTYPHILEAHKEPIEAMTSYPVESVRIIADSIVSTLNHTDSKSVAQAIYDIKEFIAEVVQKIPLPTDINVKRGMQETITLSFTCAAQKPGCLVPENRPFTIMTHQWHSWIKFTAMAAQAGVAAAFGDLVGVTEAARAVWEELSDTTSTPFSELGSQMLTSQEKDFIINGLRAEHFFETMVYNAQRATWECKHCAGKED